MRNKLNMVHLGEQRSRYTQYLPPVLWSAETDPLQFLSRLLCIFEQILTEMPVVEQTATVVTASETQIELTSATDAQRFRPYDRVTITAEAEGEIATETVQIRRVEETYLHLLVPLKGTYASGTVTLNDYASLESAIETIPQLFNPWRTPPQFLPWLASWLALSLQENWSEYQRRKFIAEMMSIYQQRGLKRGLMTYLDIYAATEANPRIAIDDGEAIFRASWTRQKTLQLHAVAYSHGLVAKAEPAEGEPARIEQVVLLHPSAIAIDSHDHYIVADRGGEERQGRRTQTWLPALWRVSNTGEVPHRDMRPRPIYTGDLLRNPVAVVIDAATAGDQCYVLVQGEENTRFPAAIYRFTLSAESTPETSAIAPVTAEPVTVINQNGWAVEPVDMVLDESQPETKRLIVLDRGDPFASNPQQPPKLIVVDINGDPPFTPIREQIIELDGEVIEPTALVVDSDGTVLIANAHDKQAAVPAELIRVSLPAEQSSTAALVPLLAEVPTAENPLIYPTGLVWKDAHTLIVSDLGVRGNRASSERTLAEPAALYQIDFSLRPPRIQQLTPDHRLVHPSKIALDRQQQVIIADQGESYFKSNFQREWRARPNEFGLVVLFSKQRDTPRDQRDHIRFEIEKVVNQQKPGHAAWWMNSG